MSRVSAALAFALVAGCGHDDPTADCGGQAGLHVVVDLSAQACLLISPDSANWSITVSTGGPVLDKTTAAHITDDAGPPRRLDYLWQWPAGATDGFQGEIQWSGSGNGNTVGHTSTSYQVELASCETVMLTAACTGGVDAGP
jgi:hypothetical protein